MYSINSVIHFFVFLKKFKCCNKYKYRKWALNADTRYDTDVVYIPNSDNWRKRIALKIPSILDYSFNIN